MIVKKILIVFIFTILFMNSAFSSTWITISKGYWNDGSIWSTGIIPSYSSSDTIIIKHPVVFENNLYLNDGAFIQIDSSGGLCGHNDITVYSNATIIKYGILELDSLFIPGGQVICLGPGQVVLSLHARLTNGGSLSVNGCSFSVGPWFNCVQPTFDFALGIEEFKTFTFHLFPNPIKSTLNISLSEIKSAINLSLYNIHNQVVYSEKIEGNKLIQLDISNYSNGVYFLNISNNNFSRTEKIIKY